MKHPNPSRTAPQPIRRAHGWRARAGAAASLVVTVIALAGCGSTPVSEDEFGAFRPAPLADAEFLPEDVEQRQDRLRVVLLEPDDEADPLARASRVGTAMQAQLSSLLGSRGFDLVDPRLTPRLADHLRLAELRGEARDDGPRPADFALRLGPATASYQFSTTPERRSKDRQGKITITPAQTQHSAQVSGQLQVYEIPSLRLVTGFPLRGSASQTETASQRYLGEQLAREAAQSALRQAADDLLNHFAFNGHVTARKTKGKVSLFLVTLGRDHGLLPGDRLVVYRARPGPRAADPRRREPGAEEVRVGEGVVSELITADAAWFAVDEDKVARQVRRGDVVRVRHPRAFSLF